MPRVAIVDTDVPNAFATGRNPKHAVVAVTTGLMRRLDQPEIEAVLAHELTHVKNRDVRTMTLASFFAMLAALITRFALLRQPLRRRARPRQQRPADLADPAARLLDHLHHQLHPDPDDLALPRVRRRPRRSGDHRRAGVPDERAAEDLEPHVADPAARPARGAGDERVLHHPDEREAAPRSCSCRTRRSRSGSPRSPRSRARWAVRSSG